MVLRPRFFAILAGSKMYRHKRTVRTTSNNIRDNVADKVSSFIKIELNNIDLIDRCKVTTFFRKCSKCRARSGRKMRNNKPTSRRGCLHTALRKAKRHVGCQTQMYFLPCRCKSIVYSANITLSARKHSTFAVALILYMSRNSGGLVPWLYLIRHISLIHNSG